MRGGPAYTAAQAAPVASVHWGASEIPVTTVDAQRDIGGAGLPGALGGDGSRVAGRATVGVVPDSNKGVVVYQGSPWRRQGGRPIPLGQPVTVKAGEAGADVHTVLTGAVVEDDGDHTSAMNMTVEDDLGFLTRTTSWPALWRVMPPAQEAPQAYRGAYRRIGLSHWYALDRALRSVHRGCHPAWPGGVGVSAPMVDSTWPEVGHLWESYSKLNGAGFQPGFRRTLTVPTRMATDAWATYAPNAPLSMASTGRIVTCFTVDPDHAAVTTVTSRWSTAHLVVQVTGSRQVRVWNTSTPATVVTYQLTTDTRVRVEVTQGGAVMISTDLNATAATGTIPVAAEWSSTDVQRVEVGIDDGSAFGGLIVTSHSSTTYQSSTGRSLFYPSPSIPATLDWMPRRQSVEVGALVADVCTATCSAWWVAADGTLRVKAPDTARDGMGQAFTTTLTSDVIGALRWSRQKDTARRQVVIKHETPRTTMGLRPNVTLGEGSGITLAGGESRVDIFNTPADEDWLICSDGYLIGGSIPTDSWANSNQGRGSLWGGYVIKESTPRDVERWATTEVGVAMSFSATAGVYRFTSTAFAERLAVDEQVVLATVPVDDSVNTSMPTRYRDQSLPLLRGWVRTVAEETETRSTRTGPTNAPDLVHEAGPWVQTGAQALADWLATKACPLPGEVGIVTLDGIPIRPDYRLEVGDVLTLHDADVTRLQLTILVRRVHLRTAAGSSTMTLDVEVVSGHSTILTVGEVDGHFAGATVGHLDSVKAGISLGADALNPTVEPR